MNKPTTEEFRVLLQQRIARIHAMSDQDLTDLYAIEMVKLKTIRQWKREGRIGVRPCSYPDTWMITMCIQDLKARRLAIPYVTALGNSLECSLCERGLVHKAEEHDPQVAYIQEIHKRIRAERSWDAMEELPRQSEPLARQHETEAAPESHNACTVYEHAIEQGYYAGMAAHLAILPNHHGLPVMFSDAGFTPLLDAITPEGMSARDTATLHTHFLVGWQSIFRGLARKRTHCHHCNDYQQCDLMWWEKEDKAKQLAHICKRCAFLYGYKFMAYVLGQ